MYFFNAVLLTGIFTYSGTRCFPFPDFPFYKCVPCPYDSIQNGTCLNVDEVSFSSEVDVFYL